MPIYNADALGVTDKNEQIITLWCEGAVTIGDVVMIDPTITTYGLGFAVEQADEEDSPLACGIARNTLTASGFLQVQYRGTTSLATADSGGAIGLKAAIGSGTGGGDGRCQSLTASSATQQPFAVCLDAFTAGTADGTLMLIDRGFFKSL